MSVRIQGAEFQLLLKGSALIQVYGQCYLMDFTATPIELRKLSGTFSTNDIAIQFQTASYFPDETGDLEVIGQNLAKYTTRDFEVTMPFKEISWALDKVKQNAKLMTANAMKPLSDSVKAGFSYFKKVEAAMAAMHKYVPSKVQRAFATKGILTVVHPAAIFVTEFMPELECSLSVQDLIAAASMDIVSYAYDGTSLMLFSETKALFITTGELKEEDSGLPKWDWEGTGYLQGEVQKFNIDKVNTLLIKPTAMPLDWSIGFACNSDTFWEYISAPFMQMRLDVKDLHLQMMKPFSFAILHAFATVPSSTGFTISVDKQGRMMLSKGRHQAVIL